MAKDIILYTGGSWDMLHVGHLNILKRAKEMGTHLVVAVSTDELIEKYKGVKPIVPYEERVALVEAIRYVDEIVKQVVLFDIEQFKEVKADIFVVGDDWENKTTEIEGLKWLRKHDKIRYLAYTEGVSTTDLKRKIIENAYTIIEAGLKREIIA